MIYLTFVKDRATLGTLGKLIIVESVKKKVGVNQKGIRVYTSKHKSLSELPMKSNDP